MSMVIFRLLRLSKYNIFEKHHILRIMNSLWHLVSGSCQEVCRNDLLKLHCIL